MSAHLTVPSPILPLVLHLRAMLARADATRAADKALMGRCVRPSLMRDMLVRLILVEHEEGRSQHMMVYQRVLRERLGIALPTSSLELHALEAANVIRLDWEPVHRQRRLVVPTDRLLAWAAEQIPRLASVGAAV